MSIGCTSLQDPVRYKLISAPALFVTLAIKSYKKIKKD